MRRKIAEVRENIEEFVGQVGHSLLLVASTDNDVAYVLKIVEQIQGEDPSAFYVPFADEFVDEQSFPLAAATKLREMYAIANAERRERQESPLPPFPAAMQSPDTPAAERFEIALEHLGRRLPNFDEHRVVLILMPTRIHDLVGYARFATKFGHRDAIEKPWQRYGRVVMRDDPTHSVGGHVVEHDIRGVLEFEVDFTTEALAADLAEDAMHPGVPVAERMQALLQLAMIDTSYKRYAEAIRKFGLLFDYYGQSEAPLMQALCLQGVGDCLVRNNEPADALKRYKQGLALAIAARSPVPVQGLPSDGEGGTAEPLHPNAPPILLNLLLAAGRTSLTLLRFEDARSYYHDASNVAAKVMNPYAAADALEQQGVAQVELRDYAGALAAWDDAERISETYKYTERWETVLQRRRQLHADAGMRSEAAAVGRKLDGVRVLKAEAGG